MLKTPSAPVKRRTGFASDDDSDYDGEEPDPDLSGAIFSLGKDYILNDDLYSRYDPVTIQNNPFVMAKQWNRGTKPSPLSSQNANASDDAKQQQGASKTQPDGSDSLPQEPHRASKASRHLMPAVNQLQFYREPTPPPESKSSNGGGGWNGGWHKRGTGMRGSRGRGATVRGGATASGGRANTSTGAGYSGWSGGQGTTTQKMPTDVRAPLDASKTASTIAPSTSALPAGPAKGKSKPKPNPAVAFAASRMKAKPKPTTAGGLLAMLTDDKVEEGGKAVEAAEEKAKTKGKGREKPMPKATAKNVKGKGKRVVSSDEDEEEDADLVPKPAKKAKVNTNAKLLIVSDSEDEEEDMKPIVKGKGKAPAKPKAAPKTAKAPAKGKGKAARGKGNGKGKNGDNDVQFGRLPPRDELEKSALMLGFERQRHLPTRAESANDKAKAAALERLRVEAVPGKSISNGKFKRKGGKGSTGGSASPIGSGRSIDPLDDDDGDIAYAKPVMIGPSSNHDNDIDDGEEEDGKALIMSRYLPSARSGSDKTLVAEYDIDKSNLKREMSTPPLRGAGEDHLDEDQDPPTLTRLDLTAEMAGLDDSSSALPYSSPTARFSHQTHVSGRGRTASLVHPQPRRATKPDAIEQMRRTAERLNAEAEKLAKEREEKSEKEGTGRNEQFIIKGHTNARPPMEPRRGFKRVRSPQPQIDRRFAFPQSRGDTLTPSIPLPSEGNWGTVSSTSMKKFKRDDSVTRAGKTTGKTMYNLSSVYDRDRNASGSDTATKASIRPTGHRLFRPRPDSPPGFDPTDKPVFRTSISNSKKSILSGSTHQAPSASAKYDPLQQAYQTQMSAPRPPQAGPRYPATSSLSSATVAYQQPRSRYATYAGYPPSSSMDEFGYANTSTSGYENDLYGSERPNQYRHAGQVFPEHVRGREQTDVGQDGGGHGHGTELANGDEWQKAWEINAPASQYQSQPDDFGSRQERPKGQWPKYAFGEAH